MTIYTADNTEQQRRPIRIVTGGQYGSEGKGSYIHHVAAQYRTHIRVGGPQAGHSIKMDDGTVHKLTTVPVGAFTPGTVSMIGPASVLDPLRLGIEMEWAKAAYGGSYPLVLVDPRCTILTGGDENSEVNSDITKRLGSTAHGVGAARERRLHRTAETAQDNAFQIVATGAHVEDTQQVARAALDGGVLIEAAQGQLLSLYSGGHYPYATSAECGPAQAFVDAGFQLRDAVHVQSTGIFRTLPIRVAGNSGPMGGIELTWEGLQGRYGSHIPEERTTVTNRVRRVATWDAGEVQRSVAWTGIDDAVVTFTDYLYPGFAGSEGPSVLPLDLRAYLELRQRQLGVPIVEIGTGFGTYVKVTV